MRGSAVFLVTLLIGACFARSSFGQQQTIGIFRVAFDEPSGPKNQEFAKPIVLKLHQSPRVPDSFHARLFRGSVASLKQRLPDADGCVHFDTAMFPVTVTGTIEMRSLDDPAWLRPAGDGFQPEEYTIVFESGDEPTVEVLGIHKTELDSYFRYAFAINLVPPENLKQRVAETVRNVETTLRSSTITYQQATKSVCLRVKTVSAAEVLFQPTETLMVAELNPCVERPPLILDQGE
jgi:hypothetical protein